MENGDRFTYPAEGAFVGGCAGCMPGRMYPWVCGRCAREFTRANLRELTVHHRDHNHADNPPDGSN